MCVSVCGCVCLSNSHLPRLFQGHHSDRYNDQWQSELQLRAGIPVLSQPIRAEMLRNQEGQAEPYESTHICTYTELQLTYTCTTTDICTHNIHIHSAFCLFQFARQQRAGNATAPPCLLSSSRHCRKKDCAQHSKKTTY